MAFPVEGVHPPPGSLADLAIRRGRTQFAREGGYAVVARPVFWKGKLAKVVMVAVAERDSSILDPQVMASSIPDRRWWRSADGSKARTSPSTGVYAPVRSPSLWCSRPLNPYSALSRSCIRFAVCRCFFGTPLSSSSIRSMTPVYGSSLGLRGGRCRQYPGGTEYFSIFLTVSRCSPNSRAASRMLIPSTMQARLTLAYISTLYILYTFHSAPLNTMEGGRWSGFQPPFLND